MKENDRNTIGIATFLNIKAVAISRVYAMPSKRRYRGMKAIKIIR